MKIGIVVLLACQAFLVSTKANHHEFQDLGATAGKWFGDINIPEITMNIEDDEVMGHEIEEEGMGHEIEKEVMGHEIEKEVMSHEEEEEVMGHELEEGVMGHEMEEEAMGHEMEEELMRHEMEEELMRHEMEEELMRHEMEEDLMRREMEEGAMGHEIEDQVMVHEMKTDGSNSSTIIDQQQHEDDHVQELLNNAYNEFHNHDGLEAQDSKPKMLGMDMEQHMEMHHNDHDEYAHLALLPHLVSDHTETHHSVDIETSPMPGLNENTVIEEPQYVQPIKYNYNNPTTGNAPQMVMRMSGNVYKPQMNNGHYGTGRKHSTNGYEKSQPQMNNRRYGTGREQYSANRFGRSQSHYYNSLNNL